MDAVSSTLVNSASAAPLGSVQGAASVSILKKATQAQAAGAAKLLNSVAQPTLATSGNVGTRLNTVA